MSSRACRHRAGTYKIPLYQLFSWNKKLFQVKSNEDTIYKIKNSQNKFAFNN